jgi:enterochelin esterase family protein
VLTYSGSYVNSQWPPNPETPQGAWGVHEDLLPNNPRKPIRLWMEVGDRDLYTPDPMRNDHVVANEYKARELAAKGYHYQFDQFVFAQNAGHGDRAVKQQTLPEALEYLWQGCAPSKN